jgi:imidazolonepropionase-like amidohydrolase
MPLLISGATIIDGVAGKPLEGRAILVEAGRIKAIGRRDEFARQPGAEILSADGEYVIPGLIDTNVHLAGTLLLEEFARFEDRYEDVIAESAQVALRNGLTTVCDTWGPRRALIAVREKINSGEIPGSRILCAGNIIGLDGPFSENFFPKYLELASPDFAQRINSTFSETVGPELTWMSPDQVAPVVRAYTGCGVDFIKYASSEHKVPSGPSAYLTFSPAVQDVIVREAHRAGLTAQAHTTSVEGLRVAVEAGCDIIQHANLTGTVPIPGTTLQMMLERKTACTILPFTKRERELLAENGGPMLRRMYSSASMEVNVLNFIESGVPLLLATDSGYISREAMKAAAEGGLSSEESLYALGPGHFQWFKAMEEHGIAPMEALKAATSNIAIALRRDKDLGSLEEGKVADMILLERNPLESADNYRSIRGVIKNGIIVDRAVLPLKPILRQ